MMDLINGTKGETVRAHNKLNVSANVNRFVDTHKNQFHFHKQIKILLALDDSFVICIGGNEYELKKDDIFIVNTDEFHDISKKGTQKDGSDVLMIHIPTSLFESYYREIDTVRCTERLIRRNDKSDSLYNKLLMYIVKLTIALFYRERGYELECMSYINSFFALLIKFNKFEESKPKEGEDSGINLGRVERIVNMINENFSNNITLTAIAEKEGLDIYYLSHFIKKHLGISFRQYVNKLKLDRAVENMARTNKKMIDICMESGYSDYRYFYKAFTDKYKCSPSQFREKLDRETMEDANIPVAGEAENIILMGEKQSFARLKQYIVEMDRTDLLEA